MEETFPFTQATDVSQIQPPSYPTDRTEGTPTTPDADAWLDNIINNDNEWIYNTAEFGPSPATSMVTDTRTALGKIYKGCKCPPHQDIYSNWPTDNAYLTIAQCMRTCIYCGRDFPKASELRRHMRNAEYIRRNLEIKYEGRGIGSSTTPSWTSRHCTEPLTDRPDARTIRSQSFTNNANAVPRQW